MRSPRQPWSAHLAIEHGGRSYPLEMYGAYTDDGVHALVYRVDCVFVRRRYSAKDSFGIRQAARLALSEWFAAAVQKVNSDVMAEDLTFSCTGVGFNGIGKGI